MNKRKIINDPVYGFINIPTELIFELISHPYFQRLRRIRQLGLAEFVYTGATHTRFQHALGAMYLMGQAMDVLRSKGIEISDSEKESAQIAILLHDLGHGPFSHVLEHSILPNVAHEEISLILMNRLNVTFDNKLLTAIEMFKGTYYRPFFNQLISSQLDIDRLDYLHRDSFFTGVVEGTIGVERIIKMMCVVDNQLAIEDKGILSIDNFLNARRIMYWQVYLHKTSIAAEVMLKGMIRLVRTELTDTSSNGCTNTLNELLNLNWTEHTIDSDKFIELFTDLDDVDLWASIKNWQNSGNATLKFLASSFLNRNLFKIKFYPNQIDLENEKLSRIQDLKNAGISHNPDYLVQSGKISNKAYIAGNSTIKIAMKNGEIKDIMNASDLPTIKALSNIVKKSYLSWVNPLYLR
ncbi:MAG: HD domain-containing protein [Spirosomaceae bacterium]|nr:HD domain-containing protein [Spirosomataceae bacterium]